MTSGVVQGCWRYPVKSMQGLAVEALTLTPRGVEGDRVWGLLDVDTGKLCSAERFSALLMAHADDATVTLPDGTAVALDAGDADDRLSAWLGRAVRLIRPDAGAMTYEMTFDPPNDDAEYFDIAVPEGTLLDWGSVHLVTTATLAHCAAERPDLDWDVRRFRPNLLLDVGGPGFAEDAWAGRRLRVGGTVLEVQQPTVRCSMPLRAQPGLERQPATFAALEALNPVHPNHLGLYLGVAEPGVVRVGDPFELLD